MSNGSFRLTTGQLANSRYLEVLIELLDAGCLTGPGGAGKMVGEVDGVGQIVWVKGREFHHGQLGKVMVYK